MAGCKHVMERKQHWDECVLCGARWSPEHGFGVPMGTRKGDGSCGHPEPPRCEACDGSGVEVFGITVYEPGCGFSHESSDERPCRECNGTGRMKPRIPQPNPSHQERVPDDDLPF